MRQNTKQKGFTLIELLVVIAIIAILSVVVILTLNPAELLRQARDSNRISDLNTMKSAISLYLADVQTVSLTAVDAKCYMTTGTSTAACAVVMPSATSAGSSTNRGVSGSGWIPIALSDISSGAPIGTLPLDPTNNTQYYYAYIATSSPGTTFKMAATMESTKYSSSGASDVASTDGGQSNLWYETGTEMSL